jgi:hypothetical protein
VTMLDRALSLGRLWNPLWNTQEYPKNVISWRSESALHFQAVESLFVPAFNLS